AQRFEVGGAGLLEAPPLEVLQQLGGPLAGVEFRALERLVARAARDAAAAQGGGGPGGGQRGGVQGVAQDLHGAARLSLLHPRCYPLIDYSVGKIEVKEESEPGSDFPIISSRTPAPAPRA